MLSQLSHASQGQAMEYKVTWNTNWAERKNGFKYRYELEAEIVIGFKCDYEHVYGIQWISTFCFDGNNYWKF